MDPSPEQDQGAAHYQRTDDPPEQHLVLILWRDLEIGEEKEEDEQVVDAQGLLDQIPGEPAQGDVGTVPEVHEDIEDKRQANPHGAPQERYVDWPVAYLQCLR